MSNSLKAAELPIDNLQDFLRITDENYKMQVTNSEKLDKILTYVKPCKSKVRNKVAKRDAITAKIFKEILCMKKRKYMSQIMFFRFKILCCVLYYTGMRISEAGSLTKKQLECLIYTKSVQVYCTKIKDYVRYYMSSGGVTALKRFAIKFDLVFAKKDYLGGAMRRELVRTFNKHLSIYGKKYDLILKSHSFRIGKVTRLLSEDIPVQKVALLVGHKDIKSTLKYDRFLVNKKLLDRIEKIDKKLIR